MENENLKNSQIRIAFIGISNSGKTALCSILSSNKPLNKNKEEEEKQNSNSKINEFIIKSKDNDIKLLDMNGKYGKVTLYGMCSLNPDYCVVVISGNMGLTQTTKEFIEISIILEIPLIFIITKYNITPDFILEENINDIQNLISGDGINKIPKIINKDYDVVNLSNFINDNICPIFKISMEDESEIDIFKLFLQNLSPMQLSNNDDYDKTIYYITNIFTKEEGKSNSIVNGFLNKGKINKNSKMLLGPDSNAQFLEVNIKSIYFNDNPVDYIYSNNICCLSIDSQIEIRKGMIIIDNVTKNNLPKIYNEFTADIMVVDHNTILKQNFICVLYCRNIRQSCQIVEIEYNMKCGDRGKVKFRFLKYPECIHIGDKIIVFESKIRAVGLITEVK